jgi:hypothetical protein
LDFFFLFWGGVGGGVGVDGGETGHEIRKEHQTTLNRQKKIKLFCLSELQCSETVLCQSLIQLFQIFWQIKNKINKFGDL